MKVSPTLEEKQSALVLEKTEVFEMETVEKKLMASTVTAEVSLKELMAIVDVMFVVAVVERAEEVIMTEKLSLVVIHWLEVAELPRSLQLVETSL